MLEPHPINRFGIAHAMSTSLPPSDLARATAVQPAAGGAGRYRADLPDDWSYRLPSGGVLMTVALRAIDRELDDRGLQPVSASALFCSPIPAGPLSIDVTVLRRGNAATQARAAVTSVARPGPGLEVSATFGRERAGADALGIAMPDVPAPQLCPPAHAHASRGRANRFFDNLEVRLALGAAFSERWEAGEARQAYWYRYRVPQRRGARFDPFAIPPIADTMPSALARRLGPAAPRFHAPSFDLTTHFLDPSDAEWFLVDVRCQRARAGYASADAEIWDDSGHLVAHATQTMMLRRRLKEATAP